MKFSSRAELWDFEERTLKGRNMPFAAHNSALGPNFKIRLDEVIYIDQMTAYAKFRYNRQSTEVIDLEEEPLKTLALTAEAIGAYGAAVCSL